MRERVCLIVDNPLRDLDGLVLVAWQLAQRGVEAWLVPMYEQGFDVFAINPDLVLANYVRPNNLDLLHLYRRAGIRVGILDTEGAGGKSADEFAGMVATSGGRQLVDLYCVWGDSQLEALQRRHVLPDEVLSLTGCPRYDYCATPWRDALPAPTEADGYILVNTNFPVVNPRFSSGSGSELRNMRQAGFDSDFAASYIRDARTAHDGMLALMAELLDRFPGQRFVLRPHPFESAEAYASLANYPNFQIRQEGTSLEWINRAKLLLHLNCSTAVEAAMLGCESVSPAWLNTPVLNVPGPHAVSSHAHDVDGICAVISQLASSSDGHVVSEETSRIRGKVLREVYHAIDGRAADRVAESILKALTVPAGRVSGGPSLRGVAVHLARRSLGYRVLVASRRRFMPPDLEKRRVAKQFSIEQVRAQLDRIGLVDPKAARLSVELGMSPGRASGTSVRVCLP